MRKDQSGNALVIILITIVLLAALAMTFSRSTEQGAGSMTKQQARISAQELLSYGQNLQEAIVRLQAKGCGENQFDLSNTAWTLEDGTVYFPAGHNPQSIPECSLFSSTAGRAVAVNAPSSALVYEPIVAGQTKIGSYRILRAQIPGIGSNKEDIILNLYAIKNDTCLMINQLAGVENPGGNLPTHSFSSTTTNYNGNFLETTTMTNAGNEFRGKTAFCGNTVVGSEISNRFSYILLAR